MTNHSIMVDFTDEEWMLLDKHAFNSKWCIHDTIMYCVKEMDTLYSKASQKVRIQNVTLNEYLTISLTITLVGQNHTLAILSDEEEYHDLWVAIDGNPKNLIGRYCEVELDELYENQLCFKRLV